MASKQELARRIIAAGDERSFNTLRKYSAELLADILAQLQTAEGEHLPNPTAPTVSTPAPTQTIQLDNTIADIAAVHSLGDNVPPATPPGWTEIEADRPYIPTDAELMQAAAAQQHTQVPAAPVPCPPARLEQWAALALAPIALLRGIIGM